MEFAVALLAFALGAVLTFFLVRQYYATRLEVQRLTHRAEVDRISHFKNNQK
ncbi:hypothetical protein [Actinokineospora spheciospongiae]|uniref:hypothetical protein n=1 Tax=Actinokineospora spheciospongiae TaxID=909613 RepID=UPI000D9DDB76|nr:hypothetical protein [Actinokineospora spheciospongiae]PWW64431.1 hypothetical protein DFQ13_103405 [Actinokineospora spheciospongiae]